MAWYDELEDKHLNNFSTSSTRRRFFDAITGRLAASETTIESLTLGRACSETPLLLSIIQGLTPARQYLYQIAFRGLKHLEVKLGW